MNPPPPHITRLAPSPTGALHLGNARTFLVNWLMARQAGWKIVLRIEDLDGPRIKRNADTQLLADLQWLGIDWDEGPTCQSSRRQVYDAAVDQLLAAGLAYPCICSRKEVDLAASAPHAEDGAAVYPGTCRGRFSSLAAAAAASGRPPAIRFAVDDTPVVFQDGFAIPVSDTRSPAPAQTLPASPPAPGRTAPLPSPIMADRESGPTLRHVYHPARQLGDFVIRKSDGTAAYQLAVVLDDLAAGVTDIVRGDDLLDSTPRQILLYRAMGRADAIPRYWHLPLVTGADGRRLAKRHGDTRLASYRDAGVTAGQILALLAHWCGIRHSGPLRTAADLLNHFDLASLPHGPIIFTPEQSARFLRPAS